MKAQSPQGLSEEEFNLLKRIMVFGISQCVTFSLMCYFNRSFHFIHLSCIMFWNASGSLIFGMDLSQLIPMLESVKNFKYGSCMIFCSIIHLNRISAILVSLGGCFLKRYCQVWIVRLVSPLHGNIVYLDISSMTTSILSIFHSQQTPFDNLVL